MIAVRWVECPPEIRAAVEPILQRWLPLLPTWCQRFEVTYRADEDAGMAINISHRNRWAQLRATGQWLDNPAEERENAVVHELIHVAMEPLVSGARRLVEDLTPEGTPLRELAYSMMCDGMECSVEDLARALRRVVKCHVAVAISDG